MFVDVCGSCASVYACIVYYTYRLVMRSIRAGLVMPVVHCLAHAWPSLCHLPDAWFLCDVLGSFDNALIVHMLHYASSITYCFCCYMLCLSYICHALAYVYCSLLGMLFNAYYALPCYLLYAMLSALSVVEHVSCIAYA